MAQIFCGDRKSSKVQDIISEDTEDLLGCYYNLLCKDDPELLLKLKIETRHKNSSYFKAILRLAASLSRNSSVFM